MAYVKSFVAGISAAAALALLLSIGSVYRALQRTSVDVHITDFYLPKWMPFGSLKVLVGVLLFLWSNASLLLVVLAFVAGFWWELHRISVRTGSSLR